MSRGGRARGGGAGRGGGRRNGGPETTWDVEPIESSTTRPDPLFPKVTQSLPTAICGSEVDRVNHYRHFRSLIRDGPLHTVLDPSQSTDDHGKVNKRSGFDPFDGMPSYSKRYQKPKRLLPDLTTRPYILKFFPKELWPTLDPKRQNPAWESLGPLLPDPPGTSTNAKSKRKAEVAPTPNAQGKRRRLSTPSEDEEDEAAIAPGRRKRAQKRDKDIAAESGQRKGLEAEDDYGPDAEQVNEEDQDGEEVVEDSAFEESDDGAGDDYNAENYFDAGDDDDFGDGGGDDEGEAFLG